MGVQGESVRDLTAKALQRKLIVVVVVVVVFDDVMSERMKDPLVAMLWTTYIRLSGEPLSSHAQESQKFCSMLSFHVTTALL